MFATSWPGCRAATLTKVSSPAATSFVQAVPRPGGMLWPRWLSFAADRYELAYDRELGHMLSFHGYLGDVLVDSVEVTSVSYGASIPQSVLDIERHPDP